MNFKFLRSRRIISVSLLAITLAFSSLFAFADTNVASAANGSHFSTTASAQVTQKAKKVTAKRVRSHSHHSAGAVTASSSTSLTLNTAKGKAVTFVITPETKFVNVTSPVANTTKVRVVWKLVDGKQTALRVVAAKK